MQYIENNFDKKLQELIGTQILGYNLDQIDFKHKAKVYIASGGLFTAFGQLGLEIIADLCEELNLDYYLPQRSDFNDKATEDFVITNKIIADGDNAQLRTCNFVFAHIQSPLDEGVAGEISRFKTMQELLPEIYWGVVGWVDDIRTATTPNPNQTSFNNQTIYFNQYCIGEVENSLGCYHTIGECFVRMYEEFLKLTQITRE
jgi:hypothetical protein